MSSLYLESLESRRLLAAVYPDSLEQYMVQLINRARADPAGEAVRDGIDLNEDLPPGTITTAPKQPLAINPLIDDAATSQANWLLKNTTLSTFSHQGPGGDFQDTRMKNAGYTLAPGDDNDENAGINLFASISNLPGLTLAAHKAYFVDTANLDGTRGHREHMMDPNFKEVGAGIVTGGYKYTDPNTHVTTTYQAYLSVIDLAEHNTVPYLTGVAFNDAVAHDNFYEPGEGLGSVNVEAVRNSDGKTFTTQTWASGGYTLALQPGTYTIYGFGGSLGGTVTYGNVTVGTQNVEKDFTPAKIGIPPFALSANGTLAISGTSGTDNITITRSVSAYAVTRTGSSPHATLKFDASKIKTITVDLGDGNDTFSAGSGVGAVYVNGGMGDDTISGGAASDTLTGAAGKDLISGNAGDDRINGGTRNDHLIGGDGNDRIYGDDDNDVLEGDAGVDRMYGGNGNDTLIGGASNDKLYGEAGNDSLEGDGQNDLLDGGDGNDLEYGGDGDDQLTGGTGSDFLYGNKGNDLFDSKDGVVDHIDGGAGTNTGKFDSNDVKVAAK